MFRRLLSPALRPLLAGGSSANANVGAFPAYSLCGRTAFPARSGSSFFVQDENSRQKYWEHDYLQSKPAIEAEEGRLAEDSYNKMYRESAQKHFGGALKQSDADRVISATVDTPVSKRVFTAADAIVDAAAEAGLTPGPSDAGTVSVASASASPLSASTADAAKIESAPASAATSAAAGNKEASDAPGLTHVDADGRASMVDVSSKTPSDRTAVASARIVLGRAAFDLVSAHQIKKGDVLTVAQLAGIMGAKKTSDLIPLCHPLQLTSVKVDLELNEEFLSVDILCLARCRGQTGVEMEALSGAAVAALTVYDMCKAVTKDMVIQHVRLVKKTGGKSDDYSRATL